MTPQVDQDGGEESERREVLPVVMESLDGTPTKLARKSSMSPKLTAFGGGAVSHRKQVSIAETVEVRHLSSHVDDSDSTTQASEDELVGDSDSDTVGGELTRRHAKLAAQRTNAGMGQDGGATAINHDRRKSLSWFAIAKGAFGSK